MTTTLAVEETVAPDEAALATEFIAFLKRASAARKRAGNGQMLRFNQGRTTGWVNAELTVSDTLPDPLRVGLFAVPGSHRALIRFANATTASDRDRDTRGMAIAVFDVVGANLTPGQTRQDIVLNSHPIMPAPDAREFLALLKANEAGLFQRLVYFATHRRSSAVALASRQHHTCHLDIPYWSTTPYAFGSGRAVKYMVRPTSGRPSELPKRLTETYLHEALAAHLRQREASFELLVQFFVDETRTPIEDAMVEWTEADAPWHAVAKIRIPSQAVTDPSHDSRDLQIAFNPWHALAEHRPLGSMNRARKEIYRAMSEYRRANAPSPQP
jgi:hypothetical protein